MILEPEDVARMNELFSHRALWLLSPGKREAFVPLFEGTLNEAIVEAFHHATFWQTSTTVVYSPNGRVQGPRIPVVKVSPDRGIFEAANQILG